MRFLGAFDLFSVLFFIGFFLILGLILFTLIRAMLQWNKNNHSPRLTVDATVVAKRTQVSGHYNATEPVHMTTASTTYYVTFQVASGDRMELRVQGHEYGMLAEGDRGALSFQGTRYLGFQRQ